ncbi:TetR/AcrR family transcriptional regulator [Actinosynnema sp. NPDC020468]|uniref:TetR/AcrR family transcriptional regulator n=1 Tax=Actinosynnema sp. NPDC020468 TaxID=3154488 RepID=UPI0034011613
MPTGVAIRDPRTQLFEAAERVLLRDGPSGLTSRAVTTEAGCAKGVLHRHFADFEDFLADLVLDRAALIRAQGADLRAAAGTGTVVDHVTDALTALFGGMATAVLGLVVFREGLRARLRAAGVVGIPLMSEGTTAIADYLAAERDLGRVARDADVGVLAVLLIGAAHLIAAGDPPEPGAVRKVVTTTLTGVLRAPAG